MFTRAFCVLALLAACAAAASETAAEAKPEDLLDLKMDVVGMAKDKADRMKDKVKLAKAKVDALAACKPNGRKGPLPFFVMQGSAYLLPFYEGVVQALQDAGAISPTTTRLAGLSGGALTAALFAGGASGAEQFVEATKVVAPCINQPGGCQPLNPRLTVMIDNLLPPNGGAEIGDRVRVWVSALTNVSATTLNNSQPYGVTDFTSNADLKESLRGTDMIPCFADNSTYNLVRGVPSLDGGFSSDFRELCADATLAGARCVTAATAVVNPKGTLDCGASLANCPASISGDYSLPADDPRAGVGGIVPVPPPTLPPNQWALPTVCPANPAAIWPPFVAQGSTLPAGTMPDIYPGARTSALRTWTACEWKTFALKPVYARWTDVYEAGLAEGRAWAVEEGYCVQPPKPKTLAQVEDALLCGP